MRLQLVDGYQLDVIKELEKASAKYPSFRSYHEGYAIIKEELDELWIEIKKKDKDKVREEAIQLSAMCLRFLQDYEKMVSQ